MMKRTLSCHSAAVCVFLFLAWLSPLGIFQALGAEEKGAAVAAAKPPRIISLYAGHTEVLVRLGAREHIVGVSRQESYTGPGTENWDVAAFSLRDDIELFLAARPDLILARPRQIAGAPHIVAALERAGIRILTPQARGAGDLYGYWRELAALVGKTAEAEAMIAGFSRRIDAARAKAGEPEKRPGVFLEAVHKEVMTFGPESFPVWLVDLAGGRNIASDAVMPLAPAGSEGGGGLLVRYGEERLLTHADEVDLFIAQEGVMNRIDKAAICARPAYRPLKAVREGKVFVIPEEYIARPTPSLLVGLEMLTEWIRGEGKE